jgi:hypothetical protein
MASIIKDMQIITMLEHPDHSLCPDGHSCHSGSICANNPGDEGHYYCDCSSPFKGDLYAGVSCEYKASEHCTISGMPMHFCTNGGNCTTINYDGVSKYGCECKTGYAGDRCEFVGTAPSGWPVVQYSS